MVRRIELPVELLWEILDYDPETGILTWKERKRDSEYWSHKGVTRFNNNRAGKEASYTRKTYNRDYYRKEVKMPDGKNYLAHRVIWAWMTGEWPEDMIDHVDQDSLNNRWENLRQATNAINQQNSTRRKDNTSGVVGVSYFERQNIWIHDTQFNGIRYKSYHDTFEEAVAERERLIRKLGFSENHGRVKRE